MTALAFRDRTGDQWKQIFRESGDELLAERGAFIAAATRYYAALKKHATFEQPPESVERFVSDLLDTAHTPCAEEVREYLIW